MIRRNALFALLVLVWSATQGIPGVFAAPWGDNCWIVGQRSAAISTLRSIAAAQRAFAAAAHVDVDGDGVGEYAYLAALDGDIAPRGSDTPIDSLLEEGLDEMFGNRAGEGIGDP